jgi:hydrogenase expression/formation protein HypC
MCLAIPGQIMRIWDEPSGARMAEVDFAGDLRNVCLAYLPQLQVGEYCMAHLGYAITAVPAATVPTVLATMAEYGAL